MGFSAQDVQRLGEAAKRQIEAKLLAENFKAVEARKTGNKYRAEKTARVMPNGTVHVFDSKKEAGRYDELVELLDAGKIRNLKIQPQYTLIEGYIAPSGEQVRPEKYKADFSYERETSPDRYGKTYWVSVVEDVKGKRTQVYINKRKQMQEKFGIYVQEV